MTPFPSIQRIAAAALLAALLLPAAAHASAWTQAKGGGQVILTGVYSHSAKGFDANGDTVDIADYDKEELYLLAEYGVTDDLTVIANPSFRHVEVEGDTANTTGLGYTELGARWRVAHDASWVASLQATARIPGARRRDLLAQVGSTDAEYDARALVGHSFTVGRVPVFVDLAGGYRFRAGDPPNEVRVDATVGIRPAPKWLFYAQGFNAFSDGAGRGVFQRYRYHNVYLNAIYDIDRHWSLQVGALATAGGENALRERGLTAGVWFRF